MPKVLQISKEEYEAVVEAEKYVKNKRIARRLQIIRLRYMGKTNSEIAQIVNMNENFICRLVGKFKKEGLEEYAQLKYKGGNSRLLSEEEETQILSEFKKRAEAGQIIIVQEIKQAFDERLGRDTGKAYIYNVLKRHNWRKVMPRSRHPQRADEETIAASKKLNPCSKKCAAKIQPKEFG